MSASSAFAAVSVSRAEVDRGNLRIEGTAAANRTITVDGVAMGTSDGSGRFRVERSGYTPPADCTVDVNDGAATAATARLSGCTVTQTPPPPPPPTTTPSILPEVAELGPGNVGADFSEMPTSHVNFGNGAVGPVRWEVIAGALPDGLAVVPHDPAGRPVPIEEVTGMQIQGTPTTVQTSTFTLRATDANGATATRTYTIRIEPARALVITPDLQQLFVGEGANLWFRGGGGVLPYRWAVTAGTVPTGMELITTDVPDGELVRVGGTPTVAGTFDWTMQLTDAQGTTTSANISVTVSPARANLSSLTVNPATVTGGSAATGTVTLDSFALDVTTVALSSSNPQAATVPASVTLQPGDTTASFPISTSGVAATTPVTISGTYAGVTQSGTLTVNASVATADTVSVARAQYDAGKRTLRVEASSSAGGATLRVYATSTNALIGTLSAGRGTFSLAANPQNITVRSSLGGSASRAVTLK
jgi:hypothetical protein